MVRRLRLNIFNAILAITYLKESGHLFAKILGYVGSRDVTAKGAVTPVARTKEITSLSAWFSTVFVSPSIDESFLHAPDAQISWHPAYVNSVLLVTKYDWSDHLSMANSYLNAVDEGKALQYLGLDICLLIFQ